MAKSIKVKLCESAKKVAVNSVGRSIPFLVHEPKMPKALAEKK